MTGVRSPSRDAFETGRFFTELSLETDRFVQQLAAVTRLPRLTSDTPIAPTRQDISMQHSNDYSNCPGCKTGRFAETTPTPEETPVTETRNEYGTRRDGEVRWADSDGDLYFPDRIDGGSAYVRAAAPFETLIAAAKSAPRSTLVQRTVTYGPVEDVKPPLPTTPGSVVRATVDGEGAGIFGLTSDGDDIPWRRVDGDGDYHASHALTDVTVIHDAGAAS